MQNRRRRVDMAAVKPAIKLVGKRLKPLFDPFWCVLPAPAKGGIQSVNEVGRLSNGDLR